MFLIQFTTIYSFRFLRKFLQKSTFLLILLICCFGFTQNHGSNKIIIIDPGHGGIDSGAIGFYSTSEKDIVLHITQETISESDNNLGLKSRCVKFANFQVIRETIDICLSILIETVFTCKLSLFWSTLFLVCSFFISAALIIQFHAVDFQLTILVLPPAFQPIPRS